MQEDLKMQSTIKKTALLFVERNNVFP